MTTLVPKPFAPGVSFRGGRSSVSGITATVFGGTSFIGRYLINRLGKAGCRVVIPYGDNIGDTMCGDEHFHRIYKPMGDLGAINLHKMSIRRLEDIEASVADSNVVINLADLRVETRRWSFQDISTSFPSVLAEVCAAQGGKRLIHVSALGASVNASSAWARAKAVGEVGVNEALPSATIMRPAVMFGDEDKFLNRLAIFGRHLPFLPLVEGGAAVQQPVYVDDVAEAIVKAIEDADTMGKTYSLAGPKVYSTKQLVEFVFNSIGDEGNAYSVPRALGMAMHLAMEQIPGTWATRDELLFQLSDVTKPAGAPGLEELGITPAPMEDIARNYLFMYKKKSPFVDEDEGIYVKQSHN